LAHTRISDEQRVVLLATAKNLYGPLNLSRAADQRIDAPRFRLAVEVDAVGVERVGIALLLAITLLAFVLLILLHAAGDPRLVEAGPLGDAVRDIVHCVISGHVLLLQEVGRMTLTLGENSHEHIGPGHLVAA